MIFFKDKQLLKAKKNCSISLQFFKIYRNYYLITDILLVVMFPSLIILTI